MSLTITGAGSALPPTVLTNDDMSKFLDTTDEWIRTRTGITKRHILAEGETLYELAITAANRALQSAGAKPQEIDYIICATLGGDYITPSLGCQVQSGIGADCPAFDLNAACSGFIYALDNAAALLDSGRAKKVLIVAADRLSHIIDWTDRSTAVLFGDTAAAVVAEPGEDLLYIKLTSKGVYEPLNIPGPPGNVPGQKPTPPSYMYMDGGEIYKFAVNAVHTGMNEAFAATGYGLDDMGHVLLHQANRRIMDAACKKMKIPAEKCPMIIQDMGNISAVSIPMLMDTGLRDGIFKKGELMVMCAFGGGLTTGTAMLRWNCG